MPAEMPEMPAVALLQPCSKKGGWIQVNNSPYPSNLDRSY